MINKTYPITEKLLENALILSLKLLEQLIKEADNLKTQTDSAMVSEIAVNKKETVSQLDKFSKQLTQVLATEKLPMTADGVTEYFKKAEAVNLNTKNSTHLWKEIIGRDQREWVPLPYLSAYISW